MVPGRPFSRRLLLRIMAALLFLSTSLLWPGCTAQKKYKVLSFFFDGVPDPENPTAILAGRSRAIGNAGTPVMVVGHKPYVEGNCNACHTGNSVNTLYAAVSTTPVSSNVCIKCHAGVPNQYPVMHGPVAVVECLWCHAPHEANDKALLRAASPGVCIQCHQRELLSKEPPEHQLAETSCLQCHFAHGGESHGFLRSGRALAPPTTVPSLTPAPAGGRT